ncbi:rhythmically expressed gene 2 protein-like [Neocloeon triangulifer]|uniref:rhythmically expressed gene 2 protein-like n=1 Tax=Neocloeon triangulifer TaxID=2078957 RepID=UPI00286F3784|nr:rhythmically expressed gene 2 protein-like [Neocloeon triangulifer]
MSRGLRRLVTFDVTGTLLKFKQPPGAFYAQVAAQLGLKADPEDLQTAFKRQWTHMNKVKPNFGLKHEGWQPWWQETVIRTFVDAKIETDHQTLFKLADTLITKFTDSSCWAPRDGAVSLLEELQKSPVTLGVVSNFDPRLHNILEACQLSKYFRFVLTSYEAGCAKPDPKIFQKALELAKIEGLQPQEALHVGDNADLDVEGAKSAGWQTWLVENGDKNKKQGGDERKGSLIDLKEHLIESNK